MNGVIYWSNTDESLNIAKYINKKTGFQLYNLETLKERDFDNIFLVFPIHYQSVPLQIKPTLKEVRFNKAVVVLTYGKINHGDALNEAQKLLQGMVVGGAYIPCKHTYILNDKSFNDYEKLDLIIDMIKRDTEIIFPHQKRNPFAKVLPVFRHRLSVKIIRTERCNNCGVCDSICQHIKNGVTDNKCFRCLKCVKCCTQKALKFKTSWILRNYLSKQKDDNLVYY